MKRTLILATLICLALATCAFAEPQWVQYPPLRNVGNLGPVVSDVESHLPAGHPYRDNDRITWSHEGTHGIAGQLRNKFRQPGFYLLDNRAVLLREPATTLSAVAATVPASLRGPVYRLYLIGGQQYWQGEPSYVFDEWVAYANGAQARRRLGIRDRAETVDYMLEFVPYAICVAKASRSADPQTRAFIAWHIERCLAEANGTGRRDTLDRFRTAPDAEALRQFTRVYLGTEWTRKHLGF